MRFEARLGPLVFVGGDGPADFTIEQDGLQGWLSGGVSMRRDVDDRPTSHGQFSAPGLLSGRMVALEGKVHASSPYDYERKLNMLSAVLADGGDAPFVVQGAVTTRAVVSRWAEPQVTPIVYGRLASYQLRLWSPDPRRYGDSATFTSGPAFHRGTFAAIPLMTVTGNLPGGYTINGPAGAQYIVTAGLAPGATDRIDMRTGWVTRNGAPLDGGVSRADTWVIRPGEQVTHTLSAPSGSGVLTVEVTDTYV